MSNNEQSPSNKLRFSLDLRVLSALLLITIITILIIWKPWASIASNNRTITVTGEAKITEPPDEFTFMPNFEFQDANKDTALSSLTKKSDEIVKKLLELGVPENKIKTNSDGYDYRTYYFNDLAKTFNYTLRPTIVVSSQDMAQKVQDYLVTTTPTGQVSPITGFSASKKKALEAKARDEATKDARTKADQSAKNLGFKIAKVKSIEDSNSFAGIGKPMMMADTAAASAELRSTNLAIQPGENDINYIVSVVYYIR